MRPSKINMSRRRGDTKRITFVIKSAGRAIPISGWTNFKLGIDSKKYPTDSTSNIATLTGAFTTTGADGRVYFPFPESIAAGDYFYDAQAVDENGEIGTFVEGEISIVEDRAK